MIFHNFKYIKFGIFLIFLISVIGTAAADQNQLVYYNWASDNGDVIVDSSGNGNNGINHGSTTFPLPTGQVARHFNGQNKITIPNNAQLSFTDPHITFGVFFRYNSTNPTRSTYLVSKGNTACKINIDHTNARVGYEILADGHSISGYSKSRVQPNRDYEAIVTYDGSHAQLYVNGVVDGNSTDYTAASLGPGYITDNWTIGSSSEDTFGLDGTIYAFYLYNRALSSLEISNLYAGDLRSIKNLNKQGGIALSWDDSAHIQTCYPYLSLFQKYNSVCTINVNSVSNRRNAVTDKEQLAALHSAGWEVACHGYNHMDSVLFLDSNSPTAWLSQEIFPNIREITSYGYPVYTLAYPYSHRDPTTDALISPYFRTLRTRTPELINRNVNETKLAYYNWDDAQLLYGVEIDDQSGASLESIENGIDHAIKTGSVLILYGHAITPNVNGRYQTSVSRLEEILKYTREHGGTFYLMGELGNSAWVQPAEFRVPTANFTVSRDNIVAGSNVTFIDYSANQQTEHLDFGDGSPASNTANVIHTYTDPGVYTVTLTVANEISSNSMVKTITVIEPTAPVADFTSDSTSGYRPLSLSFSDKSTGAPETWEWDFGDGNTSTGQNPVHVYSDIGDYTVTLTVNNEMGSNSIQKSNYIKVLSSFPSANFNSNITYGNPPLTVQFSDSSNGAPNSWNWDFGDGSTSNEQNPVHTFFTAGRYNIKLSVGNADGTSSKTHIITAHIDDDSGGNHKSSGGAGGSPEPAKNVEIKEISQTYISSGNPVKFNFPKNATDVVYLAFDSKKTVGKTKAIVETLKSRSTLTSDAPEAEIYNYLNIWVGEGGYGSGKDIENAIICFRVEKAWIQEKSIDKASIILNRYNENKWNELPATLVSEDDKYLYLTAKTPGFSPFAITGKTTEKVIEIEPEADSQDHTGNNITAGPVLEKPSKDVEKTDNSQKPKESLSGFEIFYCVLGLLGVFLCKNRRN